MEVKFKLDRDGQISGMAFPISPTMSLLRLLLIALSREARTGPTPSGRPVDFLLSTV